MEELIDRLAFQAKEEIKQMAYEALIDLGFTKAWINRSRAQKTRWERQRHPAIAASSAAE